MLKWYSRHICRAPIAHNVMEECGTESRASRQPHPENGTLQHSVISGWNAAPAYIILQEHAARKTSLISRGDDSFQSRTPTAFSFTPILLQQIIKLKREWWTGFTRGCGSDMIRPQICKYTAKRCGSFERAYPNCRWMSSPHREARREIKPSFVL